MCSLLCWKTDKRSFFPEALHECYCRYWEKTFWSSEKRDQHSRNSLSGNPEKEMRIVDIVKDYTLRLKLKQQKDDKTVKTQQNLLKDFVEDYGTYECWEINEWMIYHYVEKMKSKNMTSTVSAKASALRQFANFCYLRRDRIPFVSPLEIPHVTVPDKKYNVLNKSHIKTLMDAPFEFGKHKLVKLRDVAIIATFATTGLRVSELASLRKDQFDIHSEKWETQIIGKRSKRRWLSIWLLAQEHIRRYLEERNDNSPYLFASTAKKGSDRKLDINSISLMIKNYAKLVGIGKVTAHTLRHFFLTELQRNKTDPFVSAELAWHNSLDSTKIYTHPDRPDIVRALYKVEKSLY